MKSLAIYVVLGLVLAGSVAVGRAQVKASQPATQPSPAAPSSELALTKLKLAIAKAQIAGANAQQAQQQAQQAVAAAQQLIESTKKELGLPASYQWDFQTETFVPGAGLSPTQPSVPAPVPSPTTK